MIQGLVDDYIHALPIAAAQHGMTCNCSKHQACRCLCTRAAAKYLASTEYKGELWGGRHSKILVLVAVDQAFRIDCRRSDLWGGGEREGRSSRTRSPLSHARAENMGHVGGSTEGLCGLVRHDTLCPYNGTTIIQY